MGQTSYYHYDGLGSTQLLTDENSNVTDSYANTAFGEPVSTGAANPTRNPFQYVGQVGYYLDTDTADYYVRARVYRPVLARWLSEDPIGFVALVGNLYRYVQNNVTIAVDPTGLAVMFPPVFPPIDEPAPPYPPLGPIVFNPQPPEPIDWGGGYQPPNYTGPPINFGGGQSRQFPVIDLPPGLQEALELYFKCHPVINPVWKKQGEGGKGITVGGEIPF